MQAAMEPQQKEFPTPSEGQQDATEWHKQVLKERAQRVSQLQQRIDHDNDIINGH